MKYLVLLAWLALFFIAGVVAVVRVRQAIRRYNEEVRQSREMEDF